MQQIVSSSVFQEAGARVLWQISPWIEARFRGTAAETFQRLESQTHRRFVKTHLPIDGLPFFDEVQYSMWRAMAGTLSCRGTITIQDLPTRCWPASIGSGWKMRRSPNHIRVRRPIRSSIFDTGFQLLRCQGRRTGHPRPLTSTWRFGHWAERRRPNLLMVHYNDLLADLDGEMRRIAAFLRIDVNEDVWPSLVRAAGFKEMQARGEAITPGANRLFGEGGVRRFFNKGTKWPLARCPDRRRFGLV